MIKAFCAWLAATSASQAIQNHGWVIPAVQSVHILAIAVLATSVVAVDLKLLGLNRNGPDLMQVESRFRAWFWSGLAVLLASGLLLVVGEPARELLNPVFLTKMVLVLLIAAVFAVVQAGIGRDTGFWTSGRQPAARLLGATSVVLLLAIITCGRWIAYVVVEG